jgi:hypothetical protein
MIARCCASAWPQTALAAASQPNIVFLVLDDASPTLGSYGDPQAITPNMDRLAREGARFTRVFTHAPVCAPSRSGLVTGMYPTTLGSHHMRSRLIQPPEDVHEPAAQGRLIRGVARQDDFNFDPADPKLTSIKQTTCRKARTTRGRTG